jgi:hypothetical protein
MERLDGNVLAGPLIGLFAFDPTTATGRCTMCGDVAAVGQAMVYGHGMGYVARCRNCDNVLVVVIERGHQKSLAMPGLRWMRITENN